MEDNIVRSVGWRWLWLALPLAVSSLPWATVARVAAASNGVDLEGAIVGAVFASIWGVVLTGVATVATLCALDVVPRMGIGRYAATVLTLALPTFACLFIADRGLLMPILTIYLVMTIATYQLARKGGMAAILIALANVVVVGGLLFLQMVAI